eukprot:UN26021
MWSCPLDDIDKTSFPQAPYMDQSLSFCFPIFKIVHHMRPMNPSRAHTIAYLPNTRTFHRQCDKFYLSGDR